MNILDTDASSHHMKMNLIGIAIEARIAIEDTKFGITAVSVFETVAGAVALSDAR